MNDPNISLQQLVQNNVKQNTTLKIRNSINNCVERNKRKADVGGGKKKVGEKERISKREKQNQKEKSEEKEGTQHN